MNDQTNNTTKKAKHAAYMRSYLKAYYQKTENRERRNAASRKAYHENVEAERAKRRKAYRENEKYRPWKAAWYQTNKLRQKNAILKRKYGISLDQQNQLLKAQRGKCAICRTSDFGARGPHVDHCGRAGHVRGLLCSKCNTALGLFRHNTEVLRKAIWYLDKEVIFSYKLEAA